MIVFIILIKSLYHYPPLTQTQLPSIIFHFLPFEPVKNVTCDALVIFRFLSLALTGHEYGQSSRVNIPFCGIARLEYSKHGPLLDAFFLFVELVHLLSTFVSFERDFLVMQLEPFLVPLATFP